MNRDRGQTLSLTVLATIWGRESAAVFEEGAARQQGRASETPAGREGETELSKGREEVF